MSKSLGCARCGRCCEEIIIDYSPEQLIEIAEANPGDEDTVWIVAHWEPVRRNQQTLNGQRLSGWKYRCRRYDEEEKSCTAHDDRPPVCRRFPWYGEDPAKRVSVISKNCSYLLDIEPSLRPADSRPLIPITVVNKENS